MSSEINFPIRVVLYKEDGAWVAHCLEFDLIGSGNTKKRALSDLSECIAIQLEQSLKHDCKQNLFHPADGETWRRWAFGKAAKQNVASGLLKIKVDGVRIPDADTREYSDSMSADSQELVFA